MDITQTVGLIVGCVSLIGTTVGLVKNVFEIRKLREEIEKLQKPKETKIYLPTLDDIIMFEGNAEEYREWLEKKGGQAPITPLVPNPVLLFFLVILMPLAIFYFGTLVRFPLPAGSKLPRLVVESLKTSLTRLYVFGITTGIILGSLLAFGLTLVIPEAKLGDILIFGLAIPWWIAVIFSGYIPTYIFLFWLIRILKING